MYLRTASALRHFPPQPLPQGRLQSTHSNLYLNLKLCAWLRAVYSPVCISVGRVVSGDVPDGLTTPYQNPKLYPLGGNPNYTTVVEQDLATCDTDAVFNNSLVGPSGNPEDRMFASFNEACSGLFELDGGDDYGQESDDGDADDEGLYSPANRLAYNCSDACVDWMINFGVCAVSELKPVCIPLSVDTLVMRRSAVHIPFFEVKTSL